MNEKEKIEWHAIKNRLECAKRNIDNDLLLYERSNVSCGTAKVMVADNIEEYKMAILDYIDFYEKSIKIRDND